MFWPAKYYDRSGSDAVATAQWLAEILLSGPGVSRQVKNSKIGTFTYIGLVERGGSQGIILFLRRHCQVTETLAGKSSSFSQVTPP